MRLIRFFLCGCLLCAAPIPDVFAQPAASPPAASSAMTDKARDLYSEGVQLFRQKKWPQAEASFEAAWALAKHYSIAANLGETKLRLAKYRAAAELLAFAYRQAPATETPERKHIAGLLAEAKGKVGTLSLHVEPADAAVTVGDRMIAAGTLSEPVFVEPGSVTVTVRKDGYATATKTVDAAAGATVSVELSLPPVVTVAPMLTTTAAPTSTALPPPAPGPRKELVITGGALAGAALVAGGALVGVAFGQRDSLRTDAPTNAQGTPACSDTPPSNGATSTCDDLRSRAQTTNALGQAGIGLMIASGALGLGTAAYALWPRETNNAPRTAVVPIVTSNGAEFFWIGSF